MRPGVSISLLLCWLHRPAPSTWEPHANSPPVSSPSSEKERLLFSMKGAGLDSFCVELVVPNWNRQCGQREALTGPARPGVGGVIPFLPWRERGVSRGKPRLRPFREWMGQTAPTASRTASSLLAHNLPEEEGTFTAIARKGGGAVRENTRPEWAHSGSASTQALKRNG